MNESLSRPTDTSEDPTPKIVIFNWTPEALSLANTLAEAFGVDEGIHEILCVGHLPREQVHRELEHQRIVEHVRYMQAPTLEVGVDVLIEGLRGLHLKDARSIVVLPGRGVNEPDAGSRVLCSILERVIPGELPNIVVEVEDAEAAFEFAGLGVTTVFYPGFLRAALLAHACVDLGVFQFVYGLLEGRYRVRLISVPSELHNATFADASLLLEEDEQGRPRTLIGIQDQATRHLRLNPGPRYRLSSALGLLALEGH